jgi:hypothetical protein
MDEVFVTGHWHIVEHASHTPQPRRSAAEKPGGIAVICAAKSND